MHRTPRAFSLIESLVVVTIILVTLALLLSWIQSARDASRRARCVHNLKQIGTALRNYHATNNCYPPGATGSLNPMSEALGKRPGAPTDWSGWSPQAQMLLYLDQVAVYNSINFDFDPFINGQEPINTTAHHWRIITFICPADPYAASVHCPANPDPSQPNLNSYYASIGTTFQTEAKKTTGVFAYLSTCSAREITDGESNTIAFSEGLSGNWRPVRYRGNGVINFGIRDNALDAQDGIRADRLPDRLMQNLRLCEAGFRGPGSLPQSYSGNRGQYWTWGVESMSLFNTIVPPNSTEYSFNQCRYDCMGCYLQDADHSDVTNASSYHPGGANTLFCDGVVRFIKGSMAMPTWWALGTKSLGEAVDGTRY
jgi:prepilin-type N-terminal cleavage/methylation domain-containing protein/prepilin-type processing-associated H-X9-DG protein